MDLDKKDTKKLIKLLEELLYYNEAGLQEMKRKRAGPLRIGQVNTRIKDIKNILEKLKEE